ncbi:tryptophanyl-tRNA synthetase [Patellaria atrata CBS 101060]|uniref:Tryptophan--tRNA ligase, cytoplasmic n=1 Tax=Patellaria atrata CBS 101060 TaxID=1346257 RepID=A0A9P4S9T8_9PEZI|nr:tryptophanyl-tRNA synthetase [Patellaria atrata CBS 101060]
MENQDTPVPVPIPEDQPKAAEQVIDPWNVSGAVGEDGKIKPIDYVKLVEQFGTKLIDDALLERFERVTGQKPHRFLRRQIAFSHRDLEVILDKYEKKEPFFIYTGRGPSSTSMHIGHIVPFELTRYLSDVFQAPLVIMLTDDEKYLIGKNDLDVEEYEQFARENAKDIIACGFDIDRTFIFSDYGYMGGDLYRNITRISKRITRATADSCFGFTSSTNIGKVHFAAIQAATSFGSSFPEIFGTNKAQTAKIPCLIPCAIDQDPYFRLTRDVASQLNYSKPSLIHARFLDALQGPGSKMSASIDSSSIKLTDTPKQILKKITTYAFSGGKETLEEHREKGGNPDIDVPYNYLKFFLEDDDELAQIYTDYKKGTMLTSEIKKKCADVVSTFVTDFQGRRAKITDEMLDEFMKPRALKVHGQLSNTILPIVGGKSTAGKVPVADPNSKAQAKKAEKLRQIEAKKAQKAKEKEEKEKAAKGHIVTSTESAPMPNPDNSTS